MGLDSVKSKSLELFKFPNKLYWSFIFLLCSLFHLSCFHNSEQKNFIHKSFKDSSIFSNPDSKLYFDRANNYKKSGNFQDAETYYRKALEFDSKNPKVLLNLGNLYWETNRLKSAEECYLEIIDLDSNYFAAYANLTNVYNENKKFSLAIKFGNQALELANHDEEIPGCLISVSYAYSMSDSCQKAIEYFKRYEGYVLPSDINYDNNFKDFLKRKCN